MSAAEDVLAAIGAVVVVVGIFLLAALLGAVIGAFVGWVVGWTPLGTWILETFSAFGVDGLSMVQIGTTTGFIGGFFGSSHKCGKSS